MSDSENESRAATVGRKRIRTDLAGSYAVASVAPSVVSVSSKESGEVGSSSGSAASSRESGEISSDNESGEISSSNGQSIRKGDGGRSAEQDHSNLEDGDDVSSGSSSSSDSDSSELDDSDEEVAPHTLASPEHSLVSPPPLRRKYSDGLLRIPDVSDEEQDLQYEYFNLFKDYDIVICLCCGAKGHVYDQCTERTCKHCGAFEEHAATACPMYRKCTRCRQRGHDSASCKNTGPRPAAIDDPCDICGMTGHVEEECVKLWCTFNEPVKMRPVRHLWKNCYNCGADDEHWGDDCPYRSAHRKSDMGYGQIKTWSAEHANQYEDRHAPLSPREGDDDGGHGGDGEDDEHGADDESEGKTEESQSPLAALNWQIQLLDDSRD